MKNYTIAEVTEVIRTNAKAFGFDVLPDMYPRIIDPKEGSMRMRS